MAEIWKQTGVYEKVVPELAQPRGEAYILALDCPVVQWQDN